MVLKNKNCSAVSVYTFLKRIFVVVFAEGFKSVTFTKKMFDSFTYHMYSHLHFVESRNKIKTRVYNLLRILNVI